MSNALVIVGHGSARNPGTRLPICGCVQEIRRRELFDQVVCGLWKEDPHISVTLDRVHCDEVTIVPFFISDGYYTRQVIPKEMKLEGAITERDGQRFFYTEPVGNSALFADLIWRQALAHSFQPETETLIVLGHGTPRNPLSAINVFLQADRVRRAHPGVKIITLFIDQEPDLGCLDALEGDAVMVPLFVADGWHVTETIPEDLGMDGSEVALKRGGTLRYTPAVGTAPEMVDVVLGLVAGASRR